MDEKSVLASDNHDSEVDTPLKETRTYSNIATFLIGMAIGYLLIIFLEFGFISGDWSSSHLMELLADSLLGFVFLWPVFVCSTAGAFVGKWWGRSRVMTWIGAILGAILGCLVTIVGVIAGILPFPQ